MKVQVTAIDKERGVSFGTWIEDWEDYTSTKEVYKTARKIYGKCVRKVYVDGENGEAHPIGWVFEKKEKYDDCNKYFLQEAWVIPVEVIPQKVIPVGIK